MTRRKLSDVIAARLRDAGIVPDDAELTVDRTHASGSQRVYGAWSWFASWDGMRFDAGSKWPMRDCTEAIAWIISEVYRDQFSIDPVPPGRPVPRSGASPIARYRVHDFRPESEKGTEAVIAARDGH